MMRTLYLVGRAAGGVAYPWPVLLLRWLEFAGRVLAAAVRMPRFPLALILPLICWLSVLPDLRLRSVSGAGRVVWRVWVAMLPLQH